MNRAIEKLAASFILLFLIAILCFGNWLFTPAQKLGHLQLIVDSGGERYRLVGAVNDTRQLREVWNDTGYVHPDVEMLQPFFASVQQALEQLPASESATGEWFVKATTSGRSLTVRPLKYLGAEGLGAVLHSENWARVPARDSPALLRGRMVIADRTFSFVGFFEGEFQPWLDQFPEEESPAATGSVYTEQYPFLTARVEPCGNDLIVTAHDEFGNGLSQAEQAKCDFARRELYQQEQGLPIGLLPVSEATP